MEQYVPKEVQKVARMKYDKMVELIKYKNMEFDITIKDLRDTRLGSPIIILDEKQKQQDEIYYFPIINGNNEVILMLSVMGTSNGWRVAMDTEYVEMLKAIDYVSGDDLILHLYDTVCVAEEQAKRYLILNDDEKLRVNRIESEPYSLQEENISKQIKRLRKIEFRENISNDNICYRAYSPKFSTDTSIAKVMLLHNKQAQGDYGLCWAATVATIVNYVYGKSYTATDVADLMEIDYDAGGTLYDVYNALWEYYLAYNNLIAGQISFETIKENVDDKYPIAVGAQAGNSNHMVTLYGYGGDFVYLWNSGNEKSQLVEYSAKGTVFPYNNKSFVWKRSASFYG